MTEAKRPFQISIPFNKAMGCYELHLDVGNLSQREAKMLSEKLAEWISEGEDGWFEKS